MFVRLVKKLRAQEQEPLVEPSGVSRQSYELSRDLVFCDVFAGMVAHNQGTTAIDVPHMICGIYLGYEETAGYWDSPGRLRSFLVTECALDWPKWYYHCELYEHLDKRQKSTFVGKRMKRTSALSEILEDARGYSEKRNSRGRGGKPVMIPEDLLLAMAQRTESRICDELVKSGLVTDRLRNAVTRSPNLP